MKSEIYSRALNLTKQITHLEWEIDEIDNAVDLTLCKQLLFKNEKILDLDDELVDVIKDYLTSKKSMLEKELEEL